MERGGEEVQKLPSLGENGYFLELHNLNYTYYESPQVSLLFLNNCMLGCLGHPGASAFRTAFSLLLDGEPSHWLANPAIHP